MRFSGFGERAGGETRGVDALENLVADGRDAASGLPACTCRASRAGNGQQNRSGGPHSPQGKANSSVNATSHGCCSKQMLVKGEQPEDLEALREWWFSHYDGDQARPFVEAAFLDEWLLKRAQRNYLAVEAQLAETDATEWTEEQMHRLALMQRYKTAAERSFARSSGAVERFRRVRVYEALAEERAEAQREEREWRRREYEEENAPRVPTTVDKLLAMPKPVPVPALEQHVNVTQEGEDTVTTLTPSNEALLAQAEAMEPKPLRVFRNLRISPWLASEYVWVKDLPGTTECRTQVMTFEEWLKALEREKAIAGGHLGPVERDPTWVDDLLKEIEDGEKTKQSTEDAGQKRGGSWGTEGGPGAVGGGPDPKWTDGDGADPWERPVA